MIARSHSGSQVYGGWRGGGSSQAPQVVALLAECAPKGAYHYIQMDNTKLHTKASSDPAPEGWVGASYPVPYYEVPYYEVPHRRSLARASLTVTHNLSP